MEKHEIAWVAGIIEGEGSISKQGKGGQLKVAMCDNDVIQSLYKITGVGNTYGPYSSPKVNHSDQYEWVVTKKVDFLWIVRILLPLLHSRRASKARELLEHVENNIRELPKGVIKARNNSGRYVAYINTDRYYHLGTFDTIEEAELRAKVGVKSA